MSRIEVVRDCLAWCAVVVALNVCAIEINTEGIQEPLSSAIESSVEAIKASSSSQLNVETALAYGNLGMLLQAHALHETAIDVFTSAFELDGGLNWLYYRAIAQNEIGLVREAITDYAVIVAELPREPLMWFRYGEALYVNGQVHEAQQAFLQVLKLDASHTAAMVRLADTYIANAELQEAENLLNDAWKLDPSAGQIAFRLAQIYKKLRDDEKARLWLSRRNENAPWIEDPLLQQLANFSLNPAFFISAGQRAWNRKDYANALASYQTAIELGARDETTLLDYANMLLLLDERDLLDSFISEVVTQYPESARAWSINALANAANNPMAATGFFKKSIGLKYDQRVHANLANHFMRQAMYQEALVAYSELTNREPENPYFLYWQALAQHRLGKCEVALSLLDQVIELAPNWGQAHIVRTRTNALCGDIQSARKMAEQLLTLNDSPDTRVTMSFVRFLQGEWPNQTEVAIDKDHADYTMLERAAHTKTSPSLPFNEDSDWWIPAL